MKAFRLDDLEAERRANDGAYLQFVRERNMSVGLYALDAGAPDPQQPHRQDEVYVIMSGRGSVTVGDETLQVGRGCVVYVPHGRTASFPPHHRGSPGSGGLLSTRGVNQSLRVASGFVPGWTGAGGTPVRPPGVLASKAPGQPRRTGGGMTCP